MTREQAIKALKECSEGDPERAHSRADGVLCDFLKSLGFEDVVEAWDDIYPKWYA